MSLDKKLSDLPLETAVTGDHQLYLTNGGQSKRALVSALPIAAEAIAAKDAAEAAAAEAEQTASDILASAGTLKYYADFAAASSDIGNIAESEFVTVAADENNGGLKALYQKVGGVLTLKNVEDAQDTSAFPYLPQDKSQSYWIQKQAVELGLIPQASPSMACRFAKGEYLLAGKRYDDFVAMGGTFTRSTTGTYFGANGKLQTAAIDEPRLEFDPETGEALGLLVEESSENLLLHSNDFSQASWAKLETTIAADAAIAPDGSLTADKAVASTNNVGHKVLQNTAAQGATADTTYTFSVYAKAAEYGFLRLSTEGQLSDGSPADYAVFDLVNGAVTSEQAVDNADIQICSNGWVRCWVTVTTDSTGASFSPAVYVNESNSISAFAGDGTSGIFIWGAQLEEKAFPTSPIETAATTATRAGDVPLIDGQAFTDFFNANEGTIVVEYIDPNVSVASSEGRLYEMNSVGHNSARVQLRKHLTGQSPAYAIVDELGNIDEAGNLLPGYELNRINRHALRWSGEDYFHAFNGALDTNTSNSDLDRGVLSFLAIGSNSSGFLQPNLHIRSITAYPAEITDDEMVAVTSP